MSDLSGAVGEVRMTIEIKRAATGETETVELVGFVDQKQRDALLQAQTEVKGE